MNCKLRGFTLRGGGGAIYGSNSNITLEYNLITNNTNDNIYSGTIQDCQGVIQNNIIEFNQAGLGGAFNNCNGLIQNNIIRGNRAVGGTRSFQTTNGYGGAFYNCNGTIRNNTIVDNYVFDYSIVGGNAVHTLRGTGGFAKCKGQIVNNIIYSTTLTTPLEFDNNATPAYCLFRDAQSGTGNLASDPKFVNPAAGDYRLQSGSPAIDAGKHFDDFRADFGGYQRGLANATGFRGDGSHTDIGAHEALPKPVAVWLANGGPATIKEGQTINVGWQMDAPAGTTIRLSLYQGSRCLGELGQFTSPIRSATSAVKLPTPLFSGADYTISGASVSNPAYAASCAPFALTGTKKNAVAPASWLQYQE